MSNHQTQFSLVTSPQTPAPDEVEIVRSILSDQRLGPFTAGGVRFADWNLEEEIYNKFERPQDRVKLLSSALARHYLLKESAKVDAIIADPRNNLTDEAYDCLEDELTDTDPLQPHKFDVLLFGYPEICAREKRLLGSLDVLDERVDRRARRNREPTQKDQERRYAAERELFGIAIYKGDPDGIQDSIDRLERFRERAQHEKTLHTTTMIDYFLNKDGLKVFDEHYSLLQGEGLRSRINPHWFQDRFGQRGRYKQQVHNFIFETGNQVAAGIALGMVLAPAGKYALKSLETAVRPYAPQLCDTLHYFGIFPQ